jgi:asparagine synthase (glutamine-hydrolysing)
MADSSMFPTWLVCHLIRKHCTVALGGDGGDELFGGYSHYSRLLWMAKHLSRIPAWLRHSVANVSENFLPLGMKGRNYLAGMDVDLQHGLPLIASYFDMNTRRSLMQGRPGYHFEGENIYFQRIHQQTDLLQRSTRTDFNNYLPDDILVKVDRASMLNSLEVRAPLLDYRVIEFAFGKVPSRLKASAQDKKILLKRLASRVLPPEFDSTRKQGFSIPIADWLKTGQLRDLFWNTLTDKDCLFDQDTVHSIFKGQDLGRNNGERLFALVQFELWRKTYGASL